MLSNGRVVFANQYLEAITKLLWGFKIQVFVNDLKHV